jgi:hypothetical protein
MPDDPERVYPLELFMRDYFEPQLLPKLLAGVKLPPVADVSKINRARPEVSFANVKPSPSRDGHIDVQLRVRPTRDGAGRSGGAHDLRLFRDDKLVARASLSDASTVRALASGQEVLVTLEGIRLPSGRQQVALSAYAFNVDRVKGPTSKHEQQLPQTADLKGRAFIISFGVSRHNLPAWNLAAAANDARLTQQILETNMRRSGRYREVLAVPLVSDGSVNHASKRHLEVVLARLSGRDGDPTVLAQLPGAERLSAATPDDVVVVTFAGHGFTHERQFFLVPQEVTGTSSKEEATRRSSISSDELTQWLEQIDAADVSLVVDACHSASAVEGDGFKPGPMGAKGLGQLAYDKGIRILAASQAEEAAFENGRLQHGLLTYAIVVEGLGHAKADSRPADGRIDIKEWLMYGVQRVPQLYSEMTAKKSSPRGDGEWRLRPRGVEQLVATPTILQRPVLFDFKTAVQAPLVCEGGGPTHGAPNPMATAVCRVVAVP